MNQHIKFLLYIFSYLTCFLSTIALKANIIEVCSTCSINKIQSAIQKSVNGDTILIQSGTYKEHALIVNKSIHIIGNGEVIVDGENKETIFNITVDSFSIQGLTIKNVGHSYTKDFAAILVHNSRHFLIKDNTLIDVFFGILVEKCKHGKIINNNVSGNGTLEANSGNGIHAWHSSHLTITGNSLQKLRDGIYFEFVTKSKISSNLSHDNLRYGLHFMFSNHDDYFNNTFVANGAGVAVMFSKFINMKHNTFQDNWGPSSYGLLLKEIYDAEILDNQFIRNTTGITAEGSTRINYRNNNFKNNGWAIKISGACYQNIFRRNNFLNNSFDLSYNGQLNNNLFEGNYWSEYNGYDLDKDGTGDVAYRPVKLFSYVVNKTPETIVLLRSLFVDIINFSEKVSPVFTPDKLLDKQPLMRAIE